MGIGFRRVLAAVGSTIVACGGPLNAQVTTNVEPRVSCASCEIALGPRLQLRGEFEEGSLAYAPRLIRRSPDGRAFVVGGRPAILDMYASDGSFRGTLGTEGEGPGEFSAVSTVTLSDSVLHVYDNRLRRRTDFDLRTEELIRTLSLPPHFRSIVLSDGRTVLTGPVATREAAGQPLHVFGSDGTWERSFGWSEPVLRPDLDILLYYTIHPAGGSEFWAIPRNEHRIELWDANGTHLRTLQGDRPWFDGWTVPRSPSLDEPPRSQLVDVIVDHDGMIWTISAIASEHWSEAIQQDDAGRLTLRLDEERPYTNMMFEVIDPQTGERLAERRLPYSSGGFAGPGYLWRTWIDDSALPRAELIPISLVGR